jgi:hypothetical protein
MSAPGDCDDGEVGGMNGSGRGNRNTHQTPFIPRKIPDTRFYQRMSPHKGQIAAGRIKSIEKSNDITGNRTRVL